MKIFMYIFTALMFIANLVQASPEIATVERVKDNYVLLKTTSYIGEKGDNLEVYRLEGLDYRKVGRIEIVKELNNGVAAKVVKSYNGETVTAGDVLLPKGYATGGDSSDDEFLSGTALERLQGLEFKSFSDDSFSDSSPLEALSRLDCPVE